MRFQRPSYTLRMAAVVLAMTPEPITACEAMDRVLPQTAEGNDMFHSAKEWLRHFLPDSFECDRGWWRMEDREPRLLAVLMAADMADELGD